MALRQIKTNISLVEQGWARRPSKNVVAAHSSWASYKKHLTDTNPTDDLAEEVFNRLEAPEPVREPRRSICRVVRLSIKRIDCAGVLTGSCRMPMEIGKESPPEELLEALQEISEHFTHPHLQILTVCLANDESDPRAIEFPKTLIINQIGCHFNLPLEKMRALTSGSWIFQGSQALLDDEVYIFRGSSTICSVAECLVGQTPFVIIILEEGVDKMDSLGLMYSDRILQRFLSDSISRSTIERFSNQQLMHLVRTAIVATFSHLMAQENHLAVRQEEVSPEYERTFSQTSKFITEWHRFQEMLFQHRISCSQAEQMFSGELHVVEESISKIRNETLKQYQYELERGSTHERKIREAIQIDVATRSLEDAQLGVKVSQMGIEQAESVGWLTKLAFVFIPMTFVTGVFGMNITAFGGGASNWSFTVTMVCVSGGVFAIWFLNVWYRRRVQHRRQMLTRS